MFKILLNLIGKGYHFTQKPLVSGGLGIAAIETTELMNIQTTPDGETIKLGLQAVIALATVAKIFFEKRSLRKKSKKEKDGNV